MARVASGLDRWIAEGPGTRGLAPGARLGVLAHAASIDHAARHLLEWLRADGTYRVERLFAPEHGLWGHEQDMEPVATTSDPWTGLPVRQPVRPRPRPRYDLPRRTSPGSTRSSSTCRTWAAATTPSCTRSRT